MKTDTVIMSVLIALFVSIAQAAPDSPTLGHTLTVTPEIKKAFHSGDAIKIRSVKGTAPKFQIGGTYRVVGTCRQQTLKNATLYLGNTAEAGSDAIAASAGSSLNKPVPNGTTEFDITFTLLLCFPATAGSTHVPLPADVIMNKGAGRGDWLIVKVRLESGEESPFIVDTGSPGSVLDKSFEPRLGTRLHPFTLRTFFGRQESGLYAAPKLYLGNVPLVTDRYIATFDFKKASACRRSGIMGILGMDCLARYCIQLDFEAGTMRFLKADQVNPAELGKAFPLVLSSSLNKRPMDLSIHHTGLFGGSNTNLMIDTGYNNDGIIENGVINGHYLTRIVHFFIRFRDLR